MKMTLSTDILGISLTEVWKKRRNRMAVGGDLWAKYHKKKKDPLKVYSADVKRDKKLEEDKRLDEDNKKKISNAPLQIASYKKEGRGPGGKSPKTGKKRTGRYDTVSADNTKEQTVMTEAQIESAKEKKIFEKKLEIEQGKKDENKRKKLENKHPKEDEMKKLSEDPDYKPDEKQQAKDQKIRDEIAAHQKKVADADRDSRLFSNSPKAYKKWLASEAHKKKLEKDKETAAQNKKEGKEGTCKECGKELDPDPESVDSYNEFKTEQQKKLDKDKDKKEEQAINSGPIMETEPITPEAETSRKKLVESMATHHKKIEEKILPGQAKTRKQKEEEAKKKEEEAKKKEEEAKKKEPPTEQPKASWKNPYLTEPKKEMDTLSGGFVKEGEVTEEQKKVNVKDAKEEKVEKAVGKCTVCNEHKHPAEFNNPLAERFGICDQCFMYRQRDWENVDPDADRENLKRKAEEGTGGMLMGAQRGLGHEAGNIQGSGESTQITEVEEKNVEKNDNDDVEPSDADDISEEDYTAMMKEYVKEEEKKKKEKKEKSAYENHEQDESPDSQPNKQQIPPSKVGMDVIKTRVNLIKIKYKNIYKLANL